MASDECLNLRRLADEPENGAQFHKHMESCDACKQWHVQNQEIVSMVGVLPQFDVSEALTQNILTAVAEQPRKRVVPTNLLTPVALVAAAVCCTVLPIDSLEGFLACGVGMIGLYVVYLLVKSAPAEEVVS